MGKKVFVSYAREDRGKARRLVAELRDCGLEVWFDEDCLLPGENWRLKIEEAIPNSDYFLALLSSNSVNKKGVVQAELNKALKILEEYPPDKIYIIPVRLDDCKIIHPRIKEIQWVDIFNDWDKGRKKICSTIEYYTNGPEKEKGDDKELSLLPLQEDNWVLLGSDKYREGAEFSVGADFHLFIGPKDVTILKFEGIYYKNGCACWNLDPKMKIDGKAVDLQNYKILNPAFRIRADTTPLIRYNRRVRPTLRRQAPFDCDFGDLVIDIDYRIENENKSKSIRFCFQFSKGGHLKQIKTVRDVPRFSDKEIERLLANKEITPEQYEFLSRYSPCGRYLAMITGEAKFLDGEFDDSVKVSDIKLLKGLF